MHVSYSQKMTVEAKMAGKRDFQFKRFINAPASEVYRAFTTGIALRNWLCEDARLDACKGGRIYLWWRSGYYTHGEFVTLSPGKKIGFTWHGRGEPESTLVQVLLSEKNGTTSLRLVHGGIGTGKAWTNVVKEFQTGWELLLENLQSVLETGIDLRFARRPMLGITGAETLTPEMAHKLGVPVTAGLRLDSVIDNMAAANAGLQGNDVVVSIGGIRLTDDAHFLHVLQRHRAGDRVKLVFYRGDKRKTAMVELSPRPLPEIPPTLQELAEVVRYNYAGEQA